MDWAINCNSVECEVQSYGDEFYGDECPVTISPTTELGCIRSDIMRIVLRLVIKTIFNRYSRKCYEYLESSSFLGSSRSCDELGITTPIFHILWWSSSVKETMKYEKFKRDSDSNWSKQLDNFLFKNGIRREEKWEKINGEYVIKEEAVDKFFDEIFFANRGDGQDPPEYPLAHGGTYPSNAIKKWHKILEDISDELDESQKRDTLMPMFLMTDGVYSGGSSELDDMSDAAYELRSGKIIGDALNAKAYGLGLTGNDGLRQLQKELFKELQYPDETELPNGIIVPHYFSSKETAEQVVDAIVSRVDVCNTVCYQLAGYPIQCVNAVDPIPVFGRNKTVPEYTQTRTTKEEAGSVEAVARYDYPTQYVRITANGVVYAIAASETTLCTLKSEALPYEYIAHNADSICECCTILDYDNGDGKCMCEFRYYEEALETTSELVGKEQVLRTVVQYSADSRLAMELFAGVANGHFSSENTTNNFEIIDGDGGDPTNSGSIDSSIDSGTESIDNSIDNPIDGNVTSPGDAGTATLSSLALLSSSFIGALQAF